MRKRTVCLIMALVLALVLVPVGISAEEPEYIPVSTVEELYLINYDLTANYRLMNDIDLTADTAAGGDWDFYGNGWNPIGSKDIYGADAFSGIFDGAGHKIIGLRIDVTALPSGCGNLYLGLFAKVSGTVKNLHVSGTLNDTQINIAYGGLIAGYVDGGTVENCSTAGTATISNYSSGAKGSYLGGILGYGVNATVKNSFNQANVKYTDYYSKGDICAGGIVGKANGDGVNIRQCYNAGKIIDIVSYNTSYAHAAGIFNGNATAEQCYNVGTVRKGTSEDDATTADYAIGNGTLTDCYYLANSGATSTGATPLTAYQMTRPALFRGFDFANVWMIDPNAVYPYPQFIAMPQDLTPAAPDTVEVLTLPKKTEYTVGEEWDTTGLSLTLHYTNGQSKTVTDGFTLSDLPTEAGDYDATVTYAGVSTTFPIKVKMPDPVGDLDHDGDVDADDLTVLAKYIAKIIPALE